MRVQHHRGSREELRTLFEEAEDSAQQLDAYIDAGDVLVATANGVVVGHLQLIDTPSKGASEIKNMAVEQEHRGRGIGRMLIHTAADLSQTKGHSTLTVATAAADTGNLRFYQRVGFRIRTIEPDAFSSAAGYPPDTCIDGIPLRDRVWLDLDLGLLPGGRRDVLP